MRLPIIAPAVVRERASWPLRGRFSRGTLPSVNKNTVATMNCANNQIACNCQGTNKYACCAQNDGCHVDNDTQLCVCGQAK